MNTISTDTNIQPRSKTYRNAIVYVFPALLTWGVACIYVIPKFRDVCSHIGLGPSKVGWLWDAPFFLVDHAWPILLVGILILALFERFSRGWPRHRQAALSSVVWLVNFIVLFGLTLLFILAVFAATSGYNHK
jgi:hypothetical protein